MGSVMCCAIFQDSNNMEALAASSANAMVQTVCCTLALAF